ncbi:AAA family ATPase [Ramlibacter sp. WS9]|uniref:AAA family ATPase n=1 Tax=Ramlibacter sp. WS9 TaxID=1882741 RepID=UPI001141A00B|nr:AAA family ATPase [Ramlibacter sp. WS9]ROZ72443.1 peptidoglycan-binding protein [Ramlibacter sp. WS9]
MYAPYFGLKSEPFSIAPDPRYLFMSDRHREALAHLLYGLGGGGGFVLLSGEIGTGKTTVCRLFLEQIPQDCNVAYIFNPKLTVIELLQSVCDEFHIAVPQSLRQAQADRGGPTVKDYLDPLNAFLLEAHAAGRNNVLIIDEAQNLSAEVLEQLRLLTNLETRERKLLQIILIGQPELRTMLARPELEQLAQRVIARYHLGALTPAETAQYVQHRLEVAGLSRPLPFDRKALQRVHELSRGVPRRVNLLCDRALLGAFANNQALVDKATVDKAAAEVFDKPMPAPSAARRTAAVLGLGVVAGAGLLAAVNQVVREPARAPTPVVAKAVPASAPASTTVITPAEKAPAIQVPAAAASVAAPVLLRDSNEAWRELAQAWKAVPEGKDPCRALQKEQLQCFSKNLNLSLIRELGRPGILTLDAETGAPTYAVLTALGRDSATLRAGGTEQTVTLAALAARWRGEFSTLWRAPPGYNSRAAAAPGAETVDWVLARLAATNGTSLPKDRREAHAALKPQLRAFQLAHGLTADGHPGPLTYMQLNRAAGVEEPRLRTEP